MSESIRSFIAFDIDDETVVSRMSEVQMMLAETGADLKLVKPKNIHVTMRFLGNITLSMVDKIFREMEKVSFMPFEIEISGVGVFPNLKFPRVIWIGIKKGADELRKIFNQLEPRLRGLGLPPDPKGFSPHITIARVKSGRHKAELVKAIQKLGDYKVGVFEARCLRLKKSILTPKGPVYSTLKEVCP